MPPPWLTSETGADSLLSGLGAGVPLPWARRQGHWGLRPWTQTWSSGPASVGGSPADLGMGHPTPAHFPYLDLGAYGLPPATTRFESSLEAGASIPTWTPRARMVTGTRLVLSTHGVCQCTLFVPNSFISICSVSFSLSFPSYTLGLGHPQHCQACLGPLGRGIT